VQAYFLEQFEAAEAQKQWAAQALRNGVAVDVRAVYVRYSQVRWVRLR
jgi:hypothetical protein